MAHPPLILGVLAAAALALAVVMLVRVRSRTRAAQDGNESSPRERIDTMEAGEWVCTLGALDNPVPYGMPYPSDVRRPAPACDDPVLDWARQLFYRVHDSIQSADYRMLLQYVDDSLFGAMVLNTVVVARQGGKTRIMSLEAERMDMPGEQDPRQARVRFVCVLRDDIEPHDRRVAEVWTLRRGGQRLGAWVVHTMDRTDVCGPAREVRSDETSRAAPP